MQELIAKASLQLEALLSPAALIQLGVIALAILLAWWLSRRFRESTRIQAMALQPGVSARLSEAFIIVSPYLIAFLIIAAVGGLLHAVRAQSELVDLAITLSGLLFLIRFAVYLARVSMGDRTKGWGNTITLAIWIILALHLLGWFDPLVSALDSVGLKAGKTRITVWSIIKLLFTVGIFILIAVWVARWIERRLMSMQGLAISMRIGIAKFLQAFLIGLSVLLGLNAAGLDLTTLTVLTGAIGLGLGFGLQAIVANLVSGFVLLMDRSIKPGDVISFTGTTGTSTEGFGWVQEMRGRYVVVRDRDGVETLVPNQHLITNMVINWSYTDPKVRLKLPVRVSYRCDPEEALRILLKASEGHDRILRDPAPVSRLMGFNDYGFDMELRFWISDPQSGVNNVRSDVNRAIWRLFRENGIEVPVAQQEVVFQMKRARAEQDDEE